jgi:hypothetical protein
MKEKLNYYGGTPNVEKKDGILRHPVDSPE